MSVSKEIESIIKSDLKCYIEKKFPEQKYKGVHVKTTASYGFIDGATKWANNLCDFADWIGKEDYLCLQEGWSNDGEIYITTSELLTKFLTSKQQEK